MRKEYYIIWYIKIYRNINIVINKISIAVYNKSIIYTIYY